MLISKKILTVLTVTSALTNASAFAAATSVSDENIMAAFEQSDRPMHFASLSTQEMKETVGAFLPPEIHIPNIIGGAYLFDTDGGVNVTFNGNKITQITDHNGEMISLFDQDILPTSGDNSITINNGNTINIVTNANGVNYITISNGNFGQHGAMPDINFNTSFFPNNVHPSIPVITPLFSLR